MAKINVYVDGFNLYYGALKNTSYKWLDLSVVARRLFPQDTIHRIRYFTAHVIPDRSDPQQGQRQQIYLRALRTVPNLSIHLGFFQRNEVWMDLVTPLVDGTTRVEVIKTEEKGSDVNIASYMLMDAWNKDSEAAAIISNDSDLLTPVRIAEGPLKVPVTIVNPHRASKKSLALQSRGGSKQLWKSILGQCQFAHVVYDEHGPFRKPAGW